MCQIKNTRERERDQTLSYWYIPSAPRVDYSLLVMESAGRMKIATGEGSPPLRQGAGTGLDWFSVATEACGGGTPDLGYVLEVSVFIGISRQGGLRVIHEIGGRAQEGRTRPPPSWMAQDSSCPTLLLWGLLLVHKKSSKNGTSIGLRLVFLFCKTQKQGKNRNWHQALG